MKRKYIYILTLCSAIFCISEAGIRYSAQPPFNYTGADGSTCSQCHGNFNNGGGGITTTGLPLGGFLAGQQYDFSVTISHPDTRGRWGFSIAARDANNQPVGNFSDDNPNAGPNNGELSHMMAVFQTGTSFTYDRLRWTAPANPTPAQKNVTFYYIGNAANGDRGNTGDFIYNGNAQAAFIPISHAPTIAITNPANGATFKAGSTITVRAAASDSDGVVKKVEFFYLANGANKLGEDTTSPYELTGQDIEPGNYAVIAKATDDSNAVAVSDTLNLIVTSCTGAGTITGEGFINISGNTVANLTSNVTYPNNPAIVTPLPAFEIPSNVGDQFGARVRGYICAPQTGNYILAIASDEQSELWLSTDDNPANKRRIAYLDAPVAPGSYTTYPTQFSTLIRLIRGARYYIEALYKEGTGPDHLSVGWLLPDGLIEAPIPGSRLSPWNSAPALTKISFSEAMKVATQEDKKETVKDLTVRVYPNPSAQLFTLTTQSNSDQPLTITVTDVLGRVVEKRTGVAANGALQIGSGLKSGMYFIEVLQEKRREMIKVVRE